jgi:transketolase
MSNKIDYHELEALAQRGRWLAISTVAGSGAGHVGGPFSAMDILIALYFRVMNIRSEEP